MIRQLTAEELQTTDIINKADFQEIICLDSDDFREDKYLKGCDWYGIFDEDDNLISALDIVDNKDHGVLGLFETKETFRGQGYGSKLLKWVLDKYKNKYKYIEADLMYSDLESYYKRFGFEMSKDSKNVMKKMRKYFK